VPPDRSSRRLDRSQLPDEFTPESVRALDVRTARMLMRPDNGVLTASEQADFDKAVREVLQSSTDRLGQSLGRLRRAGPPPGDPELRRSYLRAQSRLDDQARRAKRAFPQLTAGWDVRDPATTAADDAEAGELEAATDDSEGANDVSIGTFETELEQTSDTLEILEQIATIQQQQLENQRSQLLGETRGVFFALAVSVAVIVAGVAPLVEASPDDRRLILLWTGVVCVVAGLIYAGVRAVQSRD
jgi:hypothetical protein